MFPVMEMWTARCPGASLGGWGYVVSGQDLVSTVVYLEAQLPIKGMYVGAISVGLSERLKSHPPQP